MSFRSYAWPILLCCALTLLLSGCATRTRFALPNDALLRDCPGPELTLNPAADLPAYERALQDCNADKAALRTWRDGLRGR